jgi:Fe-S oxidoreductase
MEHPARCTLFGIPGQVFLLLIMACGFAIFAYKAYEAYRLIKLGGKENRIDRIPERIQALFVYVLGQLRVFADPFAGIIHAFIFWGFLVLSIGYGNALISAFIPGFHFPLTRTPLFLTMHDIFALMVIVSVVLAVFRRVVLRPERLEYTNEAVIILGMIFLIVTFDFASEGFKTAFEIKTGSTSGFVPSITEFIGSHYAGLKMEVTTMQALSCTFWWLHFILIFSFMAFLPFSKHFHIVTAAINVFLRNLNPAGRLSKPDLENSETFGVTTVKEYTWKNLLDLFVCTECGRCSEICPAYQTGKPLSPRKVIQDLKHHLKDQAKELLAEAPKGEGEKSGAAKEILPIVGNALTEDEIWSCTTCGACQQACPVFIEHVPKLMEVRRSLVLNESKFPHEVQLTFKTLKNNYNPYGIGFSSRGDWAEGLDLKTFARGDKAEYLFWVGCVGSFDDRNKKVSRAIASLLKKGGVDFAILGAEEACCGDPARRIGNEYLYQAALVEMNCGNFKTHGIKKIITHCPHCFNTLKQEYPQFGAEIEVFHTTTIINDLIAQGKISSKIPQKKRITYHDSCYLGRYNGIYSEPREIIEHVTGGTPPAEMESNRENSFCCGAGGGRMWMEETLGIRINKMRIEEAMETRPDIISSNCPYCLTMLTDAVKDMNLEEKVQVKDITELLMEASADEAQKAESPAQV